MATGIAGQTVSLYDNSTTPPTLLGAGVTGANGTAVVPWTPTDDHTEQLQAVFAGVSGQYGASSSSVDNYTVDSIQATQTALSVTPVPGIAGSPSSATITLIEA